MRFIRKNFRIPFVFCVLLMLADGSFAQDRGSLITIAGGGEREGEDIPATDLALSVPLGAATSADGHVYIADTGTHRIRRVDAVTGQVTTIAGTGEAGFAGDGGPANEARLDRPQGIAVDEAGNVYIGDTGNRRIRRIDAATGTITTVAGSGEFGFEGDGGPAVSAVLGEIVALTIGPRGGLYIADGLDGQARGNNRVRRIDLDTGVITTLAGSGGFSFGGDDGLAVEAGMTVEDVAVDASGNIFIADFNNYRIRRIDGETGIISTVAGRGPVFGGGGAFSGDGGPATEARLDLPGGVAVGADGTLYISDTGNNRVRAVDPGTGNIFTVAGTGNFGSAGDGGPAPLAELRDPSRVVLDPDGNLLIVDTGNSRIRMLLDPAFRSPVLRSTTTRIEFQPVVVGDQETRAITIENLGARTLTLADAATDQPVFVLLDAFPIEIGPAEASEIRVGFSPGAEGVVEGRLTINTNDPWQPTLTVSLLGTGSAPNIGVFPENVVFDPTFVGHERIFVLRIANLGAGVLTVSDSDVSDPEQFSVDFSDTLRISSGARQVVHVAFRPARAGTQRAELTLFTNDPDDPEFAIPLQGVGRTSKPGGFADAAENLGLADQGSGFGAAWADYDRDGDPDLYVVRSLHTNLLYRNEGDGFTDVSAMAGVQGEDNDDGSAAAWADYDGDGDLDLYVTNYGLPNRLYRNDDGEFIDVAAEAGVDDSGDGYGAAWADVDRDGDPDLYVANFGENRFYRNEGSSFVEAAREAGLADDGSSLQPAWADYDGDGDPDLFLANSGPNRLFRNDRGSFVDVTVEAGLSELGLGGPSFGASWGDFDNDRDLDLYVPYYEEGNRLYVNDGGQFLESSGSLNAGGADTSRSRGAVWGDFDNDGDLDLYVTNGGQKNNLFRNDGDTFIDVADSFRVSGGANSRGVALADVNGDGGLDIFVAVQNGGDHLFLNRESNGNWLSVRPRGTKSSSDAIGTRFEVAFEGRGAVREITGGASYLSQDALTAAFGLGDAERVDTLTVRWPSGIAQRMYNIAANTVLDLTEATPPPPERIALEAAVGALAANGEAQIEINARFLDAQGEGLLIDNRILVFNVESGDGVFVGGDSVAVRDGQATIRFQAGTTPGAVVAFARLEGLPPERITINMLPPIGARNTDLRTVAGTGGEQGSFGGDGDPATDAFLNAPRNVAVDASGMFYISDTGNNRVRRVGSDGAIHTIAGNGIGFATGTGGPAADASLGGPRGLALTPGGDLIIAEQSAHIVRRIDVQTGNILAFAGKDIPGYGGDGRPGVNANLSGPMGVAADSMGNVWIAERFNHRVRKLDSTGIITTVAGSFQEGFSGDGGPATLAALNGPRGVAADEHGRVYIADTGNHRIRMVDTDGTISTVAGTGESGFSRDGGPAASTVLSSPDDVAVDNKGHLYIADTGNHRVRVIDLNLGIIQTVAGTGVAGFDLPGGAGTETSLNGPSGVAIGPDGRVYIADTNNHRILELTVEYPAEYQREPETDPPPPEVPSDGAADFNGDGAVDFADFILFAQAFGSADMRFDLDGNGTVGFGDFLAFVAAYEKRPPPVRFWPGSSGGR
ncbi:MAG: FG-GAP-like repeat-containing protein [Gemmatimonadota bacterium]|nr:FG-GAP-like repeat-containing protein [Gemmatimonadota bacterium]